MMEIVMIKIARNNIFIFLFSIVTQLFASNYIDDELAPNSNYFYSAGGGSWWGQTRPSGNYCVCNARDLKNNLVDGKIKQIQEKITNEILQELIDLKNFIFYSRRYYIPSIAGEIKNLALESYSNSYLVDLYKENYELTSTNNTQCYILDTQINNINQQIIKAELEIVKKFKE